MSSHRVLLRRECIQDYDDFQQERYWDKDTKTQELVEIRPMPSTCTKYNRAANEQVDEYCEGTTLVKVFWDGSFSVYKEETLNSSTCGFSFVLDIIDLKITHESILGSEDGAVEIIVSTNTSGAVEYSLDNFLTFTTNNKFTGLRPGSYTAYARNADRTISDSQTFTINPGSSSGPRYQIDYHTEKNKLTEIKIFEKDYTGTTEFLKGGGTPLTLDIKGKGDDLYSCIKPTEAQITFWAEQDFRFNEFFQEDERKFRVEIYEDGVLLFAGFLLPDVYQEPYLAPPFEIQISAVDGLGNLKDYPLSTQADNEIIDIRSGIELISLILNKIGLNLPIVSEVNLYADTMVEAANTDPLAQAWLPPACFDNKGKVVNCYEALERILKAFNARIYQEDGKWRIVRINEAGDVRNYREFDFSGKQVASGTTGTIKNITGAGGAFHWTEGSQLLRYRAAVKSVTTNYENGWKGNLIPFGDFEEKDWLNETQIKGWDGNIQEYRKESSSFNEEGFKKFEREYWDSGGTSILKYADVSRSPAFYMEGVTYFNMAYKIHAREKIDPTTSNPELYIEIKCGNYYYNQANADGSKWTTTQTLNNVCPTTGDFEYNKYQLAPITKLEAPPAGGITTVKILELVSPVFYLLETRIPFISIYTGDARVSEVWTRTETNVRAFSEKIEDTIYIGDSEGTLLLTNSIRKGPTGPDSLIGTNGWGPYQDRLHVLNAYDKFTNFEKTKQILSGRLMGSMKFSDILYDPYNIDKYFICLGLTYDQKKGVYDGEWHEVTTRNTPGFLIDYSGNYAIDYEGNKVRNY